VVSVAPVLERASAEAESQARLQFGDASRQTSSLHERWVTHLRQVFQDVGFMRSLLAGALKF
jgi:hypothetical protein